MEAEMEQLSVKLFHPKNRGGKIELNGHGGDEAIRAEVTKCCLRINPSRNYQSSGHGYLPLSLIHLSRKRKREKVLFIASVGNETSMGKRKGGKIENQSRNVCQIPTIIFIAFQITEQGA